VLPEKKKYNKFGSIVVLLLLLQNEEKRLCKYYAGTFTPVRHTQFERTKLKTTATELLMKERKYNIYIIVIERLVEENMRD